MDKKTLFSERNLILRINRNITMRHYHYTCFNCKISFSAAQIENNFLYLCPECGKSEKNMPLKGVLRIEYDYNTLTQRMKKDKFLMNSSGEIWSYPRLWPLEFYETSGGYSIEAISKNQLDKLCLSSNPITQFVVNGRAIQIFDDTRNPTLSYKDRASILVCLKAKQMGNTEIAAASTGNAASSLAGICARLGLHAHLFVPSTIPAAKRIQIQAFDAAIYMVDGNYDEAFDLSLDISREKNWYNRNTAYNPLTIEGKKSASFDIFLANKGEIPDMIFVPVGDGVIISGLYKGFWELQQLGWIKKLPRLIAVQANGSDALVRFLRDGNFVYQKSDTIADSICAGAPRNLYMAAYAVDQSHGQAISVSDEQIISAQKYIAQKLGILVEPAAAASFAGFQKYVSTRENSNDKILLMFTGNGMKDLNSLEKWNPSPELRSVAEWQKYFKNPNR